MSYYVKTIKHVKKINPSVLASNNMSSSLNSPNSAKNSNHTNTSECFNYNEKTLKPENASSNASSTCRTFTANKTALLSKLVSAQKLGIHTDITFTFTDSENNEEVKAHKLILSLESPVFETMFYGDAWKNTETLISITDIDPQIFNLLIEFIYTRSIPEYLPVNTILNLLYTASKYIVEDLVVQLKKRLSQSLALGTVLRILKAAIIFDFQELEDKCWDCIEMDGDRVLFTDEFLSLDKNFVKKILERDRLSIPEIKLYNAVIRWVDANSKAENSDPSFRKSLLTDFFKKIRFPLMEPTEFANGPAQSGLLSPEEVSNIMVTKFSTLNKTPQMFSPKKRTSTIRFTRLCQCRLGGITCCSFCQDRDESSTLSKNGVKKVFLFNTPAGYCSCRSRDYCPSRQIT